MIAGLEPYPDLKESGVPWLGEVPRHWEVTQIGRIGTLLKGVGGTKEDVAGSGVPCVRYGDLYTTHQFFVEKSRTCVSEERFDAYTPIRHGDVLFAASGETLEEIGKSAVNLIDGVACCGGDVIILRPSVRTLPRYLGYACDCAPSAWQKATMGRGTTVKHIYPGELKRLAIALPPATEQAAIVRFLDHADRHIRRYIRAKKKLIALLEEQKQAIVHRAVTRGLDPDVPLKPSGVEWLGDVPEHWEVRTLGQIASSFRTGPFGSILHQSEYVEGGTPVVNPTHMRDGGIVADSRCSVPPVVAERLSNYALEVNDVVFSRRGELGRCALVRAPEAGWLCGTGSLRVRINYVDLEPEYLIQVLQMSWVGEYLSLFSVGATMDSLNTGILKGIPVLLPPVGEQRKILETTAGMAAVLFRAVDGARREVSLLRELRTRLIADVVTGKLDVRGAAASLPDDVAEDEEAADELFDDDTAESDEGTLEEAEA